MISFRATPEIGVPSGITAPCVLLDPIPWNTPVEVTHHPTPFASAHHGVAADPDAVVTCSKVPVPVLLSVSVTFIMSEDPVAALNVHVVVLAAIVSARLVDGFVNDDHALEPPPLELITYGLATVPEPLIVTPVPAEIVPEILLA